MGTTITLDLFGVNDEEHDALAAAIWHATEILTTADAVFSTWKHDSPVSELRAGRRRLEDCPPEVAEVLELCADARAITDGWFNPWALAGGVDPTGYVKGWAAARALDAFDALDCTGVIVNAAGDVATAGQMPDGSPFRIGVTNPFLPQTLAFAVHSPGAVATSGDTERPGQLVNPFTQSQQVHYASATVAGVDLGLADALATALVVGGPAVLELVGQLAGYHAAVITHDGTITTTDAFPYIDLGANR